MKGIRGQDFTWSKPWIEYRAPNSQGVYCLRDKEGKVLFIGKGRVRERLLSHWNRENPNDAAIWDHAPAVFRFEVIPHPDRLVADLIRELKPSCNPMTRSRFPKFW
jgi:excinuclease UvrABC nuclease subunit